MTQPSLRPTNQPASWLPDPWSKSGWRWWDGSQWTANVAAGEESKPKLGAWLSVPVLIASAIGVPLTLYFAYSAPKATLFALVPLLIVLPVLLWFDRVEPEPWPSRLHALLWGAFVATTVALFFNTITALLAGNIIAAVISAPIVEEAAKGAGILWAVKRREVDSVMDGVIYAGWIALGFAVFENFGYLATADAAGAFWTTFLVRAVLTPFAHPLFTAWTGLAVGITEAKLEPIGKRVLGGYLMAVALHALWNGSLTVADLSSTNTILIVAGGLFVLLFVVALVGLGRVRRHERRQFNRLAPYLAQKYGMTDDEVAPFVDWRLMLRTRRSLTKENKKRFDAIHSALARFAAVHGREGGFDIATEKRLSSQLQLAVNDLRAGR